MIIDCIKMLYVLCTPDKSAVQQRHLLQTILNSFASLNRPRFLPFRLFNDHQHGSFKRKSLHWDSFSSLCLNGENTSTDLNGNAFSKSLSGREVFGAV